MRRTIRGVLGLGLVLSLIIWSNLSLFAESRDQEEVANLISLDLKDAELKSAFRLLAEEGGINILVAEGVVGKLTIRFKDITFENGLASILAATGCGMEEEKGVIRILPPKGVIFTGSTARPLITHVFSLNYIRAPALEKIISGFLTSQGSIQVLDPPTGESGKIAIITDTPGNMRKIRAIIKNLDTPVPQVSIESRIIEVSADQNFELGIDWKLRPKAHDMGVEGFDYLELTKGGLFKIGVMGKDDYAVTLEMLDRLEDAELLSSPRVITMDDHEATIHVGEIIPIPTYEYNTDIGMWEITGYEDQEVGITLTTTPQITQDGHIVMQVAPEISEITGWVTGPSGKDEKPILSTRRAETRVKVKDGNTIVIGGLIKNDQRKTRGGIPGLNRIPLLGYLFRRTTTTNIKTNLLIFITPHIIKEGMTLSIPPEIAKAQERVAKEEEKATEKKEKKKKKKK